MDRGPDADACLGARRRAPGLLFQGQRLAETAQVLHGDHHLELQRLAGARIHDRDRPSLPRAAEEPGDRVQRPLGRGQADPLRRTALRHQLLEALQREREVGAALRAGDRVHLVDDHVLHGPEHLAGLAGQKQVQRFRRGDEDVRWPAGELPAFLRGRVARAQSHADGRQRLVQSRRRERDSGEGRAQVPLHVVGERLQRRDVEHADPRGGTAIWPRPRRPAGQPVQAPQERSEGLAAARRRVDQRVVPVRDRAPAVRLRLRGLAERRAEPGASGGPEAVQHVAGRAPRSGRIGEAATSGHGHREGYRRSPGSTIRSK